MPCTKHKERQTHNAFPLQGVVVLKLPTFLEATRFAAQIVLFLLRALRRLRRTGWRIFPRLIVLPVTREHTLARPSGSAYAECSLRSRASAVHFVTLPLPRSSDHLPMAEALASDFSDTLGFLQSLYGLFNATN